MKVTRELVSAKLALLKKVFTEKPDLSVRKAQAILKAQFGQELKPSVLLAFRKALHKTPTPESQLENALNDRILDSSLKGIL